MPTPLLVQADTMSLWGPLLLLLFAAIAFGSGNLVLTHLFGPRRQDARKGLVYESGMNPIGNTKKRFNVRFFVVAMTFLLFSVEIVFLHPWASVFGALRRERAARRVPRPDAVLPADQRRGLRLRLAQGRLPLRLNPVHSTPVVHSPRECSAPGGRSPRSSGSDDVQAC